MEKYQIIKILTNNTIRAKDEDDNEVILIGKGIGFNKKGQEIITSNSIENIFILKDKQQQDLYRELLNTISPNLADLARELIEFIQSQVDKPLNEHIHIALTDHIAFLIKRIKMNIPIHNPFNIEIRGLYDDESRIAEQVIDKLENRLNIKVPDGEVLFITLHIVSALSNRTLDDVQKSSLLLSKLIGLIETYSEAKIDYGDLNSVRLMTHLRFAIERAQRGEVLTAPEEFTKMARQQLPRCYSLAWKLVKVISKEFNAKIGEAEVVFLSFHLYCFEKNVVLSESDAGK